MKLLLPKTVADRLGKEMKAAGDREIGGLLLGEHVEADVFRIAEATVQRSGGSVACFDRDPAQHQAELAAFFDRTGNDFRKFNYLGEWHSHPSFTPTPSAADVKTMKGIVEDASVGANFLVLLIVRLRSRRALEASATAFLRDGRIEPVTLALEKDQDQRSVMSRLKSLIRI